MQKGHGLGNLLGLGFDDGDEFSGGAGDLLDLGVGVDSFELVCSVFEGLVATVEFANVGSNRPLGKEIHDRQQEQGLVRGAVAGAR